MRKEKYKLLLKHGVLIKEVSTLWHTAQSVHQVSCKAI